MNIQDFSFHDSGIVSVSENTRDQYIDFLLDFPVNWEENVFEQKVLRFTGVVFYSIDEGPFLGPPTILDIIHHGLVTKDWGTGNNHLERIRTKIEIETNAGKRIIEYKECFFVDNL